jgi:hypothetical protein
MTAQQPNVVPLPPQPKKPKLRGIRLNSAENVLKESRAVYRAARLGTITTADAARLMLMLKSIHDMMLGVEVEARLRALETARSVKTVAEKAKRVDE